jgi:hypothetical protein
MERDARPKPTRRQLWTWGLSFIAFMTITGMLADEVYDNPWWLLAVVAWIAFGVIAFTWSRRRAWI